MFWAFSALTLLVGWQEGQLACKKLFELVGETLFIAVPQNHDHMLRYILPDRRNISYSLRPKCHKLMLAIRHDSWYVLERLV